MPRLRVSTRPSVVLSATWLCDGPVSCALELDSEGGMFSAAGARTDLEVLQTRLEPLLNGEEDIRELIKRAEADGFGFDD